MKKSLFGMLFLGFANAFPFLGVNAQNLGALSPEEECFILLEQELKKNAVFSNLDLRKVEKVNGPLGAEVRSKPFSVATYEDFLEAFNTPIPKIPKDIAYYPDEVEKNVATRYQETLEPLKTNRTILWTVKYFDDKWTPIGDVEGDGEEEKINGYFVDVRYVTFGRETDFVYPYPTRDPNAESDKDWPSGAPFKDMREYIIYTQHLAPQFGGDFLSCGIVKITPEGEFVLKSYDPTQKSIRFERMRKVQTNRGDDRIVKIPDTNGQEDRFAMGEARIGVDSNEWLVEGKERKPLLRFNVLQIMYNNGNKFMNDYVVAPIVLQEMTSPENMGDSFLGVRYRTFKRLKEELDLGIVKSLAFYEGVPFSLLESLEKIKDDGVRRMLFAALKPGFGKYAGWEDLPKEQLTPFQRMYLQYPMDYQRRVENVEYIVENTEDLENLTMDDLEYRDIEFGMVVIPAPDKRVRMLMESELFKPIYDRLEEDFNAKRKALEEKEGVEENLKNLERIYRSQYLRLKNFEDRFKGLKLQVLSLEQKREREEISQAAYEEQMQEIYHKFKRLISEYQLDTFLTNKELDYLENLLLRAQPKEIKKGKAFTPPKNVSWYKRYGNYLIGAGLLVVAIVFALWGLRLVRPSSKKKISRTSSKSSRNKKS